MIEDCSEGGPSAGSSRASWRRTGLDEPSEPIEPGAVGWRKWPESALRRCTRSRSRRRFGPRAPGGWSRSAPCRGQTTVRLLDLLGPESEVHVIDPVPQFDPSEHERQFPGPLPLPSRHQPQRAARAAGGGRALIDGDHNWYTVFNELEMLAAAARKAGAPLPLLILHDVGWPYGRRDLYYAPEQIPEEFRQPYARKGIAPGRSELLGRRRAEREIEQRGPRGRSAQRRDDRARGLRRRRRGRRCGWWCCRSTSASRSSAMPGGSTDRPELGEALDRIEDSRPAVSSRLRLAESLRVGALARDASAAAAAGERLNAFSRALPRRRQGGAAGRALPRERGQARIPRDVPRARQEARPAQAPRSAHVASPTTSSVLQERRTGGAPLSDLAGKAASIRTRTIGRSGLDHLERRLETIQPRGRSAGTSRPAASGAVGARSSCARSSRPTTCRVPRSGSRTASAARRGDDGGRGKAESARRTWLPISTPSARGSTDSGSSTTGCGSCRAPSPRRWPTRRSASWRCSTSATRAGGRPPTALERLVRPGRARRLRGRSRTTTRRAARKRGR